MQEKLKTLSAKTGCFLFVLSPVVGALFYPSMNWLLVIPFALLVIAALGLFGKGPDGTYYAELAERLLTAPRDWDVDDYESVRPREPKLRALVCRNLRSADCLRPG